MSSNVSRVSIVIPTRNGIATLPVVLDAIAAQEIDIAKEVVAVDSRSTDGTAELLRNRCDKVLSIDPSSFDHGLTRNLGIQESSGDLVVLLVQDALPEGKKWLHELIAPLRDDERIAASWCRQLARQDASALTRRYHGTWLGASKQSRLSSLTGPSELESLEPLERLRICTLDNVCSCLRRSVWQQHPFRSTVIAEDLEWAREVLLAGHRIQFTSEAAVIHSHDRSSRYELDRTIEVHRRLLVLFGVRTIPDLGCLARSFGSALRLHLRCLMDEAGWARRIARLPRYLGLALAWPLGQYIGGKQPPPDDEASRLRI